ncbi:MAG: hypothetical protein F6J93_28205 [Oscillatoria sp. SIO1A7]|nr:hypothetical protein [Oscillatoria sp. SIO1A7]
MRIAIASILLKPRQERSHPFLKSRGKSDRIHSIKAEAIAIASILLKPTLD